MHKRSLRKLPCTAVVLLGLEFFGASFAAGPATSFGQTTQPTVSPDSALEFRATQALNSGQYATALPLLREAARSAQNQPDKLANLQEEIRVCEKNLQPGAGAQVISSEVRTGPAVPAGSAVNAGPIPNAGSTANATALESAAPSDPSQSALASAAPVSPPVVQAPSMQSNAAAGASSSPAAAPSTGTPAATSNGAPTGAAPTSTDASGAASSAAASATIDPSLANQAGVPPTPPMSADTRIPHPAPKPGETVSCDIKELGNFEYDAETGGNIPKDVLALNGCHFRTHGFMMPLDQVENITDFAFVPSLFGCCFGQPPQVQHTIIVHCAKGKSIAEYTSEELVVEGTLRVQEKKDEGFVISIFEIDATSVRAAAK
jgi:hypothetical protein